MAAYKSSANQDIYTFLMYIWAPSPTSGGMCANAFALQLQ